MSLKAKLTKMVDNIDEKITDLATLDVITVSGDITQMMKSGKYLKPKDIVNAHFNDTKAKIKIRAFYHVDFDQDTTQYIADDLNEGDLLYHMHLEAIESAKKSRMAMLNFIKEIVD